MQPRIARWVADNKLFLAVCCGYALCRLCFELAYLFPGQSYAAGELGKLMGLIAALFVAYRLNVERRSKFWNYAPSILVLAACIATICTLGREPGGLFFAVSCFILGCGASSAMIQWLEYCAMMPCKRIVIAIAAAYLLNSVVSLLIGRLQNPYVTCVVLFACGVGLCVLRFTCEQDRAIAERSVLSLRKTAGIKRELFPLDMLVWIAVTGLSFGLVEQGGGMMIGSLIDSIGRMVPCIIVLVGYSVFANRFDLRFLYSSILPLIVASLTFMASSQAQTMVPGLCLSMGTAALRIITYSLVCVRAYQMGVSSFFGSACVMISNVGSHAVGRAIAGVPFIQANYSIVLSAFVVLSVTVIVFLIMSEAERIAYVDDLPGLRAAANDEAIAALADQKGLTAREANVLVQMAHGKTNAEIADALFITVGAVRSHTSRIYQKFGVGTREDLDEIVKRFG